MAGITGRTVGYGYPQYGFYPPAYQPTMNGYQMPQAQAPQQMTQQPGPVPGNPQLSKPTVHADIVQIENEAAGEQEPVDAGTSQMMITKDESAILIKSVLANGETTMDIYRKIPPAPKKAEPEYVTREEFDRWIAEIESRKEPEKPILRALDPEPAEDEQEYEPPAPRPVQRTRTTTGGKRR